VAAIGRVAPLGAERVELARGHREQRIAAQRGMIIEILVTQRQPMHALREQLRDAVLDKARLAPVAEARRERAGHSQAVIDLPQQQCAPVAAQMTAGKIRHHFARPKVLKEQGLVFTVCRWSGVGPLAGILLHTRNLPEPAPLFHLRL